jgi:hypothetical protein
VRGAGLRDSCALYRIHLCIVTSEISVGAFVWPPTGPIAMATCKRTSAVDVSTVSQEGLAETLLTFRTS